MMDYMLLFNVTLPPVLINFLELCSVKVFEDIPNIMKMLVDDDCPKIKPKFEEQELTCQFLSNLGSNITCLLIIVIMKLIIWLVRTAAVTKNTLMTSFGITMTKINNGFGYEFFLKLIDMIQLDLYIGVFL